MFNHTVAESWLISTGIHATLVGVISSQKHQFQLVRRSLRQWSGLVQTAKSMWRGPGLQPRLSTALTLVYFQNYIQYWIVQLSDRNKDRKSSENLKNNLSFGKSTLWPSEFLFHPSLQNLQQPVF